VLFLVVLFIIKNISIFKNTETYQRANQENGLIYGDETVEILVNKDTDGDGILDWEEGLWGTDPMKKETTPGTSDSVAIDKLKAEQGKNNQINKESQTPENLTKTDQFSRELFATIVTLNQNGQIDQTTIDQLSSSLVEQIQNSVPRKIYAISDIKIIDNDTKEAIQKYSDTLNSIYTKYYTNKKSVMNILQQFITDEENTEILKELDPIINQTNKIISESLKIQVPRSLSLLHLDLINNSQKLLENISDLRLFDSDIIVAISAIGQYEKNASALATSASRLIETIKQKLNN